MTVPQYAPGQPPHLRRNGTSPRPPLSLRGRRPWQSASLRPPWGRAARCAAGVTDCHVGLCPPRNDVVTWWKVLLFGSGGHGGNGTGAVPYGLNFIRRADISDQSRGPNGVIRPPACQNELSAATRRRKTKGPPGGRVVLLSDSGEGGRNRLEEAFAVRHCQT